MLSAVRWLWRGTRDSGAIQVHVSANCPVQERKEPLPIRAALLCVLLTEINSLLEMSLIPLREALRHKCADPVQAVCLSVRLMHPGTSQAHVLPRLASLAARAPHASCFLHTDACIHLLAINHPNSTTLLHFRDSKCEEKP